MPHPPTTLGYAELDPQQLLDALDAVGLRGDGRVLQLNSYENRVFQVFLEDGGAVVAKFYRPGRWTDEQILEEHAFALELAEAEVPVVPPLRLHATNETLANGPGTIGADPPTTLTLLPPGDDATLAIRATPAATYRYAVARRHAGREPELDAPGVLHRLGAFIGRLHAVGARRPFEHRLSIDPARMGRRAIDLLLQGGFVTPDWAEPWQRLAETALARIEAAFDAVPGLRTLRLHGDCHIGNVLWRDEGERSGAHIVDLDDACNGPAVQDLWMLVSGDATTLAHQLDRILSGYRLFAEFDERERRLIEPLRTLRMLRHSAWLAERWGDPTFPINFPYFGDGAYWSQQVTQLREQIEAMEAAAG
jgi:Ser/Thr protein kinase RdoA (MazF antagonist)